MQFNCGSVSTVLIRLLRFIERATMRRSKRDVTHKYSTKAMEQGALQPEHDVGEVPVEAVQTAHPGGSTPTAEGGKAAEGQSQTA